MAEDDWKYPVAKHLGRIATGRFPALIVIYNPSASTLRTASMLRCSMPSALRLPPVNSQEAEHKAQPPQLLHSVAAKPQGDEETPRQGARDQQHAAKREDVKQLILELNSLPIESKY